ncbi:hypothetical protein PENTCL1PPCAC_21543, partial [Pristionchus entomophagus]
TLENSNNRFPRNHPQTRRAQIKWTKFAVIFISSLTTMRLVVLAVALFAVGASIKCYDGLIRWGPGNEEPGLTLKECATTCCTVVWSLPGTIYSCGERCPSQREFVRGEKCESAPVDSSWCHCSGPVGKCKPKL